MGLNINADCFITAANKAGLLTKQSSLPGIRFILSKMRTDPRLNDIRHAAYMFATIKHETAHTYLPIKEYDNKEGTYLISKSYYPYFGRGYVQLTWKGNYDRFGKVVGKDLVNNPDLALNYDIAYTIMSVGMLSKPNFTGVNLHKYLYGGVTDYYNARKVINGTSGAEYVAGLAESFESVINKCIARSFVSGPMILAITGVGIFGAAFYLNRKGLI